VRVHIEKTLLRKRYKCFAFRFEERLLQLFDMTALPNDWQEEPPPPSLQSLGDEWAKSGASAILAVPSVIIPKEFNFLVNPRHPDFTKLQIDAPTDFAFDPRLFK
ncbi:MAG TPA: RES family NAD+ phosphorylase, partial [Verrucomicrobiae bacterium]|nr:RES family NAD+ phosphorylase [Verrucomicrobiae bacterium]